MELAVQKRNIFGRQVKTLRKQGLIPAELYGHGLANLHLAVPAKDFMKVFKKAGENTIVNIVVDNEKRPTFIYGIATDPVTDEITNIDFYQVRLDEKIKIKVPVVFIGESAAVKAGGILVKAVQELEVEALPGNIPSSFEVDLSRLTEIGQSFYVRDLSVPSDVKLFADSNTAITTITAPMTEEEEAALAQTADVSTIKSETEEKKAEREAEKTEKGETPASAEAVAKGESTPAKPQKK